MGLTYRVHPQITLEEVAGRYFLISFGEAGRLPYLREINETGAFYWELAAAGHDLDSMLAIASDLYQESRTKLEKGLLAFFDNLMDQGYVSLDETQ